jgi:hypothetical protein
MDLETVPGTDIQYALISFDADGNERSEQSGLMSQAIIKRAVDDSITNVFFFCHGWQGDLPAAKDQYGKWLRAFADSADWQRAPQRFPKFRPLLIGLHWPSKPWGDEELRGGSFGAPGGVSGRDALVQMYVERLGNRPEIRRLLEIIIDEARKNAAPEELPSHLCQAYLDLNDALGLKSEGVGGSPDTDREGFDPQSSFEAANEQATSFGVDFNFGGLLGPLRQLSYWTMKKRARDIGEGGMHKFLNDLQEATATQNMRIHLMGHSFGTIVVSGMIGGPNAQGRLVRSVDSVALVQGAVSLWCYASAIPFPGAGAGYFSRILAEKKVRGPLLTTRSKFDDAVGVFYPLASRIKGSASFAGELPEFGAIGAYGIQGVADGLNNNLAMKEATADYTFEKGKVYNLDGSAYIAHKDGPAGAHSDIAGPEVAHAIWAAAFASI